MRAYFKQLRCETGLRMVNKVFENSDKPSKVSEKNLKLNSI